MVSKRTLINRIAGLLTAGVAAGALSGGTVAATPPDGRTANDATHSTNTTGSGLHVPYDAGTVVDADSVFTVTGRPSILGQTGLPRSWAAPVRSVVDRYETLRLDAFRYATGSVALADGSVEGCGVFVGTFDRDALVAELDAGDTFTRTSGSDPNTRFIDDDAGRVLAVASEQLVIADAADVAGAEAHTEAALDRTSRRARTLSRYGDIPSLLDGDAVAYATLGPVAKTRLRAAIDDAPDSLSEALAATQTVGASLSNGPVSTSGFDLRYAATTSRLSDETVDELTADATAGDESFSEAEPARRGRTVVVDATVDDGTLFDAHADLVGRSVADVHEVSVE